VKNLSLEYDDFLPGIETKTIFKNYTILIVVFVRHFPRLDLKRARCRACGD
jgi:hypothetical protein